MGRPAELEEHYTLKELAACWKVSPRTLQVLIRRGDLHAIRLGHVFRVPASEVRRIEQNGRA